MRAILFIWLGGGFGSVLRYLVQLGTSKLFTVTFPAGTFVVNISGCFVIGLLYGLATKYAALTMEWRLFLITGICGGYTTFSSFSYEGISLFRQGNYTYFILYTVLSVVVGLLSTFFGMTVVK
ncbi:fluoride efflux transporter CrcB [Terrimonas sp.]|uniref:fluoride efflux transporter CrcB n=1 Tax=Terrimonas sp. TaxID=1914338 RepID=UPI000D5244BC|nr:fluoride efflux transporter CrcB [Terrimonas sp.]PVD51191.1 fluoride efflux transporter CrcB [Terrimonas sp.]